MGIHNTWFYGGKQNIKNDHPVAFLNLDHGREMKLESWHWVTIVGLSYSEESDELYANIADDGLLININLGLWLETSRDGGGFIYFQEKKEGINGDSGI